MAFLAASLTVVWLAAIVVAPFLTAPLSALVYAVGSLVCHQLPDRSFHIGASQLPVCARCLGVYVGAACGALGGVVLTHGPADSPLRPSARQARWSVGIALVPTVASVVLEAAGLWRTTNVERSVMGFPAGLVAAFVVMSVLATLHYTQCVPRRPTAPSQPPSI